METGSNENQSLINLNFKYLPPFARWILENHLETFSRLMLDLSQKEHIPILRFFTAYSDEQLLGMGKVSATELLNPLANNQALEHINKTVGEWIANQLGSIDRQAIVAEDISMISYVRREVFRQLLEKYTNDVGQFRAIMEEVDRFTAASDIAAYNGYIKIQQEMMQTMTSSKSALLEKLQAQEEYLAQLIKNAPDAVIVIDENSIVRLWNAKAEYIFGWKEEEVRGRHLTDTIVPHRYREAHNRGMRHYLSTGEGNVINRSTEITALNKRNEELFISLTISETIQQGSRAFIAFLRDVTEAKQTQIALRNQSLLLEQRNLQLERSNQELEAFNYAASHDLQEPLRKIQVFANRIIEDELDVAPGVRGYVEKINSSAARMQNLIDDLLKFSQLTTPGEAEEFVNLSDLLEEARNLLAHQIEESGTRITSTALPVVRVVPFQFLQVFINLLSNAIKYRKPGVVPAIWIRSAMVSSIEIIEHLGSPQNYIQLSVADNGMGFDPDFSNRLFDLFTRLHSQEKYPGTGIGLAICKKIVHNHQGFIRAESDGSSGSTFHIFLPEERLQRNR